MTIADLLTEIAGVWRGTYTVVTADGRLLERFPSQQEGRMEGTEWYERVVYLREDQEPQESFFHATVEGDAVQFHNSDMWGETSRLGDEAVLFTFGWKDRPGERIIEMSRPSGDYRSRVWQHFEDGELTKLTIIEERRQVGEKPVEWKRDEKSL